MIEVKPFLKSIHINWTPIKEYDVMGYRVHAVKANELVNGNFTPTESNMIFEGTDTSYVYPLPAEDYGGMHYIKIAAYDSFGIDELNYSDLISVYVPTLQIMPDELFTILRADFYIRDSTFLFGYVDTATGTITDKTLLHWDEGWIDQSDKTFVLQPGEFADGTNSYIIATLVLDASAKSISGVPADGYATLRQVSFGAGLPTLEKNEIIIVVSSPGTNAVGNYMAYVRQGNSMMVEGMYIRDATIGDAKIYGTLHANKINTLNGGVEIGEMVDGGFIQLNSLKGLHVDSTASKKNLEDMASDGKITPQEKIQLFQDYKVIQTEYYTVKAQAESYGLDVIQLNSYYDALNVLVSPVLVDMTTTSDVTSTSIATAIANYYGEKAELQKNLSDDYKLKTDQTVGLLDDLSNDSKLTPLEKTAIKLEMELVVQDAARMVAKAAEYGVSSATYVSTKTALVSYTTPLFTHMDATSTIDRTTFNNTFKAYYDAKTALDQLLTDKAKQLAVEADAKAVSSLASITEMSSDSVLSPIEKQAIKKEMESLATEYTALYNLAASHNYPSTATLAGNYNNLVSFMSTYLSSLTTSSNVAGATVRSYFASYYDSAATTNSWLTHNVKELADAAQTKANAAAASALVAANTAVWGNISGIPSRFASAPLGAGLYLTSSNMGYYNGGSWQTYMDSYGNFYLTGSNPEHSLAWNATSNTLRVRGDIEANTIKANAVVVNTSNIVGNAVTIPCFATNGSVTIQPGVWTTVVECVVTLDYEAHVRLIGTTQIVSPWASDGTWNLGWALYEEYSGIILNGQPATYQVSVNPTFQGASTIPAGTRKLQLRLSHPDLVHTVLVSDLTAIITKR